MQETISRLKTEIREVLGEKPSDIFLSRLDRTLEEASDMETLAQAAEKVERLVKLFIGVDEAKIISERCREIM